MYTQEDLIQAIETLGYYQASSYIMTMYGVIVDKQMLDKALEISNTRYAATLQGIPKNELHISIETGIL
jgi:hypothetical protein